MATITPLSPQATHSRERIIQWVMNDDDEGAAWNVGPYKDVSVQAGGTWGGATLVWQGSNDGTNWVTLSDAMGTALSFTDDALKEVLPRCKSIRPVTSGGASSEITATLAACS